MPLRPVLAEKLAAAAEEVIQVCADVTADATLKRELRALDRAAKAHRRAERTLLVLDRDSANRVSVPGIRATSAPEWLLEAARHEEAA